MMNEQLLSLFLFAAAMTFSPGPNNVLMATSGAQVGVRNSVPLGLGIITGMMILLSLSATGLAAIIKTSPLLLLAIKVAGTTYLCWLAWKIATAGPIRISTTGPTVRYGFAAGLMNTLLNPKGWTAAISAAAGSTALATGPLDLALVLCLVFLSVNIPNWALWCSSGHALSRLLHTDRQWRILNGVLGLTVAASFVSIWFQ
jgi:threonine/homoserine/homoserine lactone efflux protein